MGGMRISFVSCESHWDAKRDRLLSAVRICSMIHWQALLLFLTACSSLTEGLFGRRRAITIAQPLRRTKELICAVDLRLYVPAVGCLRYLLRQHSTSRCLVQGFLGESKLMPYCTHTRLPS
jgi:hypothetical protein